jgi:hypothetical protein
VFGQHNQPRSELYLDHTDPTRATAIYVALYSNKDRFELVFGRPLSWEDLPARRASRIAAYSEGDADVLDTTDTSSTSAGSSTRKNAFAGQSTMYCPRYAGISITRQQQPRSPSSPVALRQRGLTASATTTHQTSRQDKCARI